jgi:hypothetical protein
MIHNNGVDTAIAVAAAGNPHDDRRRVMAAATAADPLGSPAAMAVGSLCALAAQGKDGGGSKACFAQLALRIAQGEVGRGALALALLASLGLRSRGVLGVVHWRGNQRQCWGVGSNEWTLGHC